MYLKFVLTGFAMSWITTSALAQHAHNDIEFGYDNSVIHIEFTPEARIFEGEFPTSGLFPRFTDDPGFLADEPAEGLIVGPNDLIGYNIHEDLFYWDGTQEQIAPIDASITINDALGNPFSLTGSTGESLTDLDGPFRQIIGQASAGGIVHEHIDFILSGTAPIGAYGVLMSLSSNATGINDSQIFGIVFNYGLDEEQFENGVDHYIVTRNLSSVPEPSSALAIGLCGMTATVVRRRRS